MSASQSSRAKSTVNSTSESPVGSGTGEPQADRRTGVRDRRVSNIDRRNEDRVADEFEPRRNPDIPDRRKS